MAQLTSLSRDTHATKRWLRFSDYSFAAKTGVVPVAGVELVKAGASMPIAFIQVDGRYQPVAVMSLRPGSNMFVGPDGRWLGAYIPAVFRAYPFRLMPKEKDAGFVLCIADEERTVVDADSTVPNSEPLFDSEGKLSPATQFSLDFLTELERSRVATDEAMAVLADAGIIRPWELKVMTVDQEQLATGLYRIDEIALKALDDEAFLKVRKYSALTIAYAQLFSMQRITIFEQLATLQKQLAQVQVQLADTAARRALAPDHGLQLADDGLLIRLSPCAMGARALRVGAFECRQNTTQRQWARPPSRRQTRTFPNARPEGDHFSLR